MHKNLLALLAVLYLVTCLAVAQSNNGRILGSVADASGAFVTGAKVVITDSERGISRTFTTHESGEYVAPSLRPGLYVITAEAPGFKKSERPSLGGTFTNKAINDLPLNGRDFQNLVTLRPGVQRYPGGGFLSISSNGNRPEDNTSSSTAPITTTPTTLQTLQRV